MKRESFDLIVVGGGPAGSTLAALVKKYAPERRVLLLEKSAGPRHHVGESLLPGCVPVLKELGVFEKVDAAGFPRKIGASYVWGRDREVWENDFNDVNVQAMIERYGEVPPRIEYAWQVRRSRYDELLLRHAEELGVEVRRGVRACGILEEGDGRIAGLSIEGPDGPAELRADTTADCSGQDGFLSKFRKVRKYNPALKNAAAYAYFRGAPWMFRYTGHPDKTKIFICTAPDGWFWYIPLEKDLVSVGFVTQVDHIKALGVSDLRAFFFERLAACPELRPLLEKAEVVADFDGTGKDFFTHSDWSYLNAAASGPGWLAAGDAAVFVDPILSSGIALAHLCAHRAAYTLLTAWKEEEPRLRELVLKDYDLFCRESAAQYLALALFWYGNDRSAESWWGKAAELQRAWLPVELSDKGAFVTVSAGLTQYYDRLFSTRGLFEEPLTKPEEFPFYMTVFKAEPRAAPDLAPGARPRLAWPYETEIVFLPVAGQGRLQPVKRVRFLKEDGGDPLKDAFNPRKIVTRWHLEVLAAIDGARTTEQVLAEAGRRGAADWWLRGPARTFLAELRTQGALVDGLEKAVA